MRYILIIVLSKLITNGKRKGNLEQKTEKEVINKRGIMEAKENVEKHFNSIGYSHTQRSKQKYRNKATDTKQ